LAICVKSLIVDVIDKGIAFVARVQRHAGTAGVKQICAAAVKLDLICFSELNPCLRPLINEAEISAGPWSPVLSASFS
jgi:hypothetical protein